MIAQVGQETYTPEEYLKLEMNAEERHEYIGGDIIPMAGGTPNHNRIILNLASVLSFALKRQPFNVFIADQRLWLPKHHIYTYPGIMVIQGDLEYQAGRNDTLTNPVFIAEVLSESTKAYDRDKKFKAYRTISSFQEYLLIDQSSIHLEQYVKQDEHQWLFTEYDNAESLLKLSTIPCEVQLADIYDKVETGE